MSAYGTSQTFHPYYFSESIPEHILSLELSWRDKDEVGEYPAAYVPYEGNDGDADGKPNCGGNGV